MRLCLMLAVLALPASLHAQATAVDFATVSMTNATTPKLVSNSLCYTDGRDIACDRGVSITAGGIISANSVQIVSQSSPATCTSSTAGTIRYNSPTTTLELCTGTGWQPMGVGVPAGTISAFASTTCPTGWSEYTAARGRFLRGIDNGAGNDPSGTRTPGSVQADLLRSHSHDLYYSDTGGLGSVYAQLGNGSTGTKSLITSTGGAETRPVNIAVTFCQFNGTSNGWNNPLSGGSTVAAGSTSQIQYNTGNAFDASANLTWTNASNRLTATNISATALTVNGVAITGSGGASKLASLTDVAISSPVSGSVLAYNGTTTSWTAMPVQNVMSTTTMQTGWPDAITCNTDSGARVYYLSNAPSSVDGKYYYAQAWSDGGSYYISYLSNGSYDNKTGTPSSIGDCQNSISTLYSLGRAFNFIGTANASGSMALGDRITSGTTAVTVNSATAYVSLSTAGSTWGYLGSVDSYLPKITTAQVSATTISTTAVQIFSPTTALACSSSTAGTIRYNSPTTTLELCTGTGWQSMGVGVPAGTISAFASTTCPTGWSEYTAARGRFLRGIDNGAGVDPNGTRAPGATQADAFQGHRFSLSALGTGGSGPEASANANAYRYLDFGTIYTGNALSDGSNGTPRTSSETRPVNVAVTYCQFNGTSNGWNNPLSGGSTIAAGSTSQIQYNTGNAFDASANLTWTNASSRLTATNISATALTVNGVAITGSGGASKLASLTDVAISSPVSGSVLAYNGTTTSWTAMPVQNVMSTTTMVNGIPDAIECLRNDAYGTNIWYLGNPTSGSSNYTVYIEASTASVMRFVTSTKNYADCTGTICSLMSTSDCANTGQGLPRLYTLGRAFNFIGTGPSAADNIVSGTTSVVANTAGTINFNTSGVTTGYMDTAGRLVVPGISATTNQSSFTTGYFSGRVGIGMSSAAHSLQVSGAIVTSGTDAGLLAYDRTTGSGYSAFYRQGTSSRLWDNAYGDVITFTPSGNVGIRATNPQFALDVSSTTGTAIRAATSANAVVINAQGTHASSTAVGAYAANGTVYALLGNNNLYALNGRGQVYTQTGAASSAVYGENTGANYGVYGLSAGTYGVYGRTTASGSGGVLGYAGNGSTWGSLGYANQYSLYGNGDIATTSGGGVFINAGTYNFGGVPAASSALCNSNYGQYYANWYTVGYCSSDRRLKKNIHHIQSGGLAKIMALKPANYVWKSDKKAAIQAGFIAQEVMNIIPEAVSKPSGSEYYAFEERAVLTYAVKAIQELKTENDILKTQLDALNKRLDALESK